VKNQGKAHIIVKFFVWTFFWKKRKISGQKSDFSWFFNHFLFIVENHLQFGVFSMILSFFHAHANFS